MICAPPWTSARYRSSLRRRASSMAAPVPQDESPNPRPYFFFAGRLERIKGLDDVIPVFRDYPDADLLIAGDGNDTVDTEGLVDGSIQLFVDGVPIP